MVKNFKIAKECRPKCAYDGSSDKVDCRSHVDECRRVISDPHLPMKVRQRELQYWFSGAALMVLEPYLCEINPTDETLNKALRVVVSEFAPRPEEAEVMLSAILSGEPLGEEEFPAICSLVYGLEKQFHMAERTNRGSDWHRESLYQRLLVEKFPFLVDEWCEFRAQQEDNIDFPCFLQFLKDQLKWMRVAHEMRQRRSKDPLPKAILPKASLNPSKPTFKACKQPIQRDQPSSKRQHTPLAPKVNKTKASTLKPCCHRCKQEHWLEHCPLFLGMSTNRRMDYLKYHRRCTRCTMNHDISNCCAKVKCGRCGKPHADALHNAYDPVIRGRT